MVKYHLDSEKQNPLPPLYMDYFRLAARDLLLDHPTDKTAQTPAFVIPVVEHWVERQIAQSVHHDGSIRISIVLSSDAIHRTPGGCSTLRS